MDCIEFLIGQIVYKVAIGRGEEAEKDEASKIEEKRECRMRVSKSNVEDQEHILKNGIVPQDRPIAPT